MSQSLAQKLEAIESLNLIHKHLISLSAVSQELSRRTHLDCECLVRVHYFCHWVDVVAVPEVNGRALSAGHQLALVVFSLSHPEKSTVLGLVAVHSLFLLEVVSGDTAVH